MAETPKTAEKTMLLKCITDRKPWAKGKDDKEARPYAEDEQGEFSADQARALVKAGFFQLWDEALDDGEDMLG